MQMFLNVASLACCGDVSRLPVDRCLGWLSMAICAGVSCAIVNNSDDQIMQKELMSNK